MDGSSRKWVRPAKRHTLSVNLARGGIEQIIQVGFGVVLGIVLALLFAVTGRIVPLIIFHTLLNISGSVTAPNAGYDTIMLLVTTVISAAYAIYLVYALRQRGPAPEIQLDLPTANPPRP